MSRAGFGERHPEELISASLTGDLSEVEQTELDQHLGGCADCQATLAAFREERRLVSGLHHVPPPVDLHARVTEGIAAASVPWWQRPRVLAGSVAGLAVAAAMLALAVFALNDPQRPVGETSDPAPTASVTPSATPDGSFPPVGDATPTPPPPATPAPSATAAPTATPAGTPAPTPTPTTAPSPAPQATPDVVIAYVPPAPLQPLATPGLNLLEGATGELLTPTPEPTAEPSPPPSGPPVNAVISPDGTWLVYMTEVGEKGTNEIWATHLPDGERVRLGETLAGSPFLEQTAWSSDSRYLAFSVSDDAGVNAWLFDATDRAAEPVTRDGNVYAGGFLDGADGAQLLWLSTAGEEPSSFLIAIPESETPQFTAQDGEAVATAEGVFQPLLNADRSLAIYWRGRMQAAEGAQPGDWLFAEAGAPYLAEVVRDEEGRAAFENERALFSDLTIDRQAFASAEIAWGADGRTFAVWAAQWVGEPQSAPDEPLYPDPLRVYFSSADDPDLITGGHVLDEGDVPEEAAEVTHVAISPDGQHLSLTVRFPVGGILSQPEAKLFLVKRNTGTVADEVEELTGDTGWLGPAVYRQAPPADAPAESPTPEPTATP